MEKKWWERPLGITGLGILVTVIGGLILWSITGHYDKPTPSTAKPTISGAVVDQDNRGIGQATITLVGRTEQYFTEDTGNFIIDLPSDIPKRVRLHVTKSGFQPLDMSVEPAVDNLVLALHK
jgi:hypothetical protein